MSPIGNSTATSSFSDRCIQGTGADLSTGGLHAARDWSRAATTHAVARARCGVRLAPMLTKIPAGRLGELDDLVGAAVFLCGEGARCVNGQILYVDGGLTAAL